MTEKRVGVLTGGGDAPGLNPAIKGLVYRGSEVGLEVIGLFDGWRSLMNPAPDVLPLDRETYRRHVVDAFWNSQYLREWTALLASEEVAAAVARRGWRLGFMPHPDMQPMLPHLDLPDHVEPISFAGTDVQGIYAQCALLVTDYSSVAFDLAYIERPVVYYQFDGERVFSGAHIGKAGYFDYRRDGFGPVAESRSDAIAEIVAAIENGPSPTPEYLERIQRTFTMRDGGASARVVEALENFDRPPRRAP